MIRHVPLQIFSTNTSQDFPPRAGRSPGLDALEPGAGGAISYGVHQIGEV